MLLQVSRSQSEAGQAAVRDNARRAALWEILRSDDKDLKEICAPPLGSLAASGEISSSMRRVINGTRQLDFVGNDERVGEKETNRLLAIERGEKET